MSAAEEEGVPILETASHGGSSGGSCPGSPSGFRHRRRSVDPPGFIRTFGLDRLYSWPKKTEHLFIHECEHCNTRDVVRIRGKDQVDHALASGEEVEHEHYVGGYRYRHKHKDPHEAHDLHGKGHGYHYDGKGRGGAKVAAAAVLCASLVALALGTYLALGGKTFEGMPYPVPLLARAAVPALVFCGLAFALASGSYFAIAAFYGDGHRRDGVEGRDGGPHFALMCVSHALSAWEDRMWQFAVPVLMMRVFRDTLLPGALFALVQYLGVVFLMPKAGALIDGSYRIRLARHAIALENVCIFGTCALLGLMVHRAEDKGWKGKVLGLDGAMAAYYSAIVVLGVVGEVCNQILTISLEQDWVVVLAKETGRDLTRMNVNMKRIDLLCKVLAPGLIGVFLDFFGLLRGQDAMASALCGILLLGLFNALAWPLEVFLLGEIHDGLPGLQMKRIRNEAAFYEDLLREGGEAEKGKGDHSGDRSFLETVKLYCTHRVFLASLSFCMLFMTVMDNGTLVTSYLVWRQVNAGALGLQRGVGAVVGLAGTFVYPKLAERMGYEKVGLWSIWAFTLCMAPGAAAQLLLGPSRTSDWALIAAMVVSRAALWAFDLAERQVMQEECEEESRGALNACQVSCYQTLYCVIQVFGMVFSNPANFSVLTAISLGSLVGASAVYTMWYTNYHISRTGGYSRLL